MIYHNYYKARHYFGQLLIHKYTSYYEKCVLLDKNYIFFDYERISYNICDNKACKSFTGIQIVIRFNNLLLFNLVFSILLGDKIEPVLKGRKKFIIFLRIHFHGMVCIANMLLLNMRGEQRV